MKAESNLIQIEEKMSKEQFNKFIMDENQLKQLTDDQKREVEQLFSNMTPSEREESTQESSKHQYSHFSYFENMPKHIRNEIKEDILTTILQDRGNELTEVPEVWESQLREGRDRIELGQIEAFVSQDVEKLSEMKQKRASNEQSKDDGDRRNTTTQAANDQKNNILGRFIQDKQDGNGFDCYMWWP